MKLYKLFLWIVSTFFCIETVLGQDIKQKTDLVNIQLGMQAPMPIHGMVTPFTCIGGSMAIHAQQEIQLYGGASLLWRTQHISKGFMEVNHKVCFGAIAKKSTRRSWFLKSGLGVFIQHPYVVYGERVTFFSTYLNLVVGRDFYFNDYLGMNIEVGGFASIFTLTQTEKVNGDYEVTSGLVTQGYYSSPINLSYFPAAPTLRVNLFYRINTKK